MSGKAKKRRKKKAQSKADVPALVTRDESMYTSQYCEENIYKLCEILQSKGVDLQAFSVLFISNPGKVVLVCEQKSSKRKPLHEVFWDYHVILVQSGSADATTPALVYDLDSRLPFPCAAHKYVAATFRPDLKIDDSLRCFFNVIPAALYLRYFASDRSHMRSSKDPSRWLAEPPAYPCIQTPDCKMNLMAHMHIDLSRMKAGEKPVSASGSAVGSSSGSGVEAKASAASLSTAQQLSTLPAPSVAFADSSACDSTKTLPPAADSEQKAAVGKSGLPEVGYMQTMDLAMARATVFRASRQEVGSVVCVKA